MYKNVMKSFMPSANLLFDTSINFYLICYLFFNFHAFFSLLFFFTTLILDNKTSRKIAATQ